MAEQSALTELAARNAAEIKKQVDHLLEVQDDLTTELGLVKDADELFKLEEQIRDIEQQLQALRYEGVSG